MSRQEFEEYDIEKAFFPVELKSVYVKDGEEDNSYRKLSRHHVVMDKDKSHPFAVVTSNYHLVSNEEAYEKSKELFSKVFGNISYDDMQCFNVTMPSTRSFCHIDFIHKESDFDVWENDSWTPFIRITNSYNRTKLLKYELGFCRWICRNGMIFWAKSVEFSYSHSKSQKENIERFAENIGDIKQIETDLIDNLTQLKNFPLEENLMFPLVLKVFDIQTNIKTGSTKEKLKKAEKLLDIKDYTASLSEKYFDELGANGYSAFNVLTDFATRPVGVISPASQINSYQKKCGSWMEQFISDKKTTNFSIETYLDSFLVTAKIIESLHQKLNGSSD
jgi:hypothetical protein